MAQHTETLNWDTLTSHFEYRPLDHTSTPRASNLYLRLAPNQTTDIYSFATEFAYKIAVDIKAERQKYPEKYQRPKEDDYLLDDATALKISPTVQRLHYQRKTEIRACTHHDDEDTRFSRDDGYSYYDSGRSFSDGFEFNCDCALPLRERKVHAFLRQYRQNGCYMFERVNGAATFNMNVTMALLVHGELDLVLRICSHPDVDYQYWREVQQCQCVGAEEGWDQLYRLALRAYLVLNIMRQFPKLRVPGPKRTTPYTETYRDTKLYQEIVYECTNLEAEVPGLSHYYFFGMTEKTSKTVFQRRNMAKMNGPGAHLLPPSFLNFLDRTPMSPQAIAFLGEYGFPYGHAPFEVFRDEFSESSLPHETEREEVCHLLRSTVLPEELVIQVMDEAGYNGRTRQLLVAHDPLAEENATILDHYLAECWRIMVQCSVFAHGLGEDIKWKQEVIWFLRHNIRGPEGQLLEYVGSEMS
ncbi:hypothetical protein FE257_004436 [Aspergillus nanangensis]|uniref:Uncharacterized protein n=1 Tax=Aspergillus nanangensis TaxID=2582783 RepID=A0AAD4CY10_ASPNN|nr:hypothetical protein FE257_004436 [Aspergillus nanangensis]